MSYGGKRHGRSFKAQFVVLRFGARLIEGGLLGVCGNSKVVCALELSHGYARIGTDDGKGDRQRHG